MTPHELRIFLRALRTLRSEAAPAAHDKADVIEHIVMWDFISLVARGHGHHAALARAILDSLAHMSDELPLGLH